MEENIKKKINFRINIFTFKMIILFINTFSNIREKNVFLKEL